MKWMREWMNDCWFVNKMYRTGTESLEAKGLGLPYCSGVGSQNTFSSSPPVLTISRNSTTTHPVAPAPALGVSLTPLPSSPMTHMLGNSANTFKIWPHLTTQPPSRPELRQGRPVWSHSSLPCSPTISSTQEPEQSFKDISQTADSSVQNPPNCLIAEWKPKFMLFLWALWGPLLFSLTSPATTLSLFTPLCHTVWIPQFSCCEL